MGGRDLTVERSQLPCDRTHAAASLAPPRLLRRGRRDSSLSAQRTAVRHLPPDMAQKHLFIPPHLRTPPTVKFRPILERPARGFLGSGPGVYLPLCGDPVGHLRFRAVLGVLDLPPDQRCVLDCPADDRDAPLAGTAGNLQSDDRNRVCVRDRLHAWKIEWFDLWRHEVPSASYLLLDYVPPLTIIGACGWWIAARPQAAG